MNGKGVWSQAAKRLARMSTMVALACGLANTAALAQKTVPIYQEPRHRLVFEHGPVKILDVQIHPGDTTFYHVHDSAILYVTINNSTTDSQNLGGEFRNIQAPANANANAPSRAGNVSSVTSYTSQPLTHRVTNVGTGLFRLMAIANYGPGTDSEAPEPNPPGDQLAENRWFRAWRVQLEPGQSTAWHRSATPVVAVQVVAGEVEVSTRGEDASVLRVMVQPGEWFHGDAGIEYRIRNRGGGPVQVVVVSAR
jgi:quercetin dioxygenase-like cupin family protein